MKKLPPQIDVPESAEEVTAQVKRLLRAAEVGNEVPTAKSAILACAELVETGELDLRDYEASFKDKARGFFYRAMSKVYGFLDRRTQLIYVDSQLHDSRKLFVTYHEVTHRVLPWQNVVYTEDDEVTLSANCRTLFEAEANFGAAEILFQCNRFEEEARDYELSITSALYLANRYDASCHSALRRFVERNHRPCLLLVLKPTARQNTDGATSYFIAYSIRSSAFTLEFGEPIRELFLNPEDDLGKIVNSGLQGEIVLEDIKGIRKLCSVECFSNMYHTFVLIHPKHQSPRRIVVRSYN